MNAALNRPAMLARRMVLGSAAFSNGGYRIAVATLAGSALLVGVFLDGVAGAMLMAALMLLFAAASSFMTTASALRARQVLGGLMVPGVVIRAWRRGWAQGLGATSAALVAAWLLEVVLHRQVPRWPLALLLLCFIVHWQAIAACVSVGLLGRGYRAASLLSAVVLFVAFVLACVLALQARAPVAAAGVSAAVGLLGLVFVARRVGPAAVSENAGRATEPDQASRPHAMQRWTPPSSLPGRPWWWIWFVSLCCVVSVCAQSMNVLLRTTSLWTHGAMLLWSTVLVMGAVSMLRIHWREWLQPRGPRRDRIGRLLFLRALKVFAPIGLPLFALGGLIAAMAGVTPVRLAMSIATCLVSFLFSTALAVCVSGRWSMRAKPNRASRVIMMVTLFAVLGVLVGTLRHAVIGERELLDFWPRDLALLLLVPCLVAMADRFWLRRDLNDLVQRDIPAPS